MCRRAFPAPALAALLAALAWAPAAWAVDVGDGKLSLHADGQWAFHKSTGQNAYDEATPAGNYDTAAFDLVLAARPAEDLVISAQLGFGPAGGSLEWGFAEWRFSDLLRLRMGKVQQPFGNLNELRTAGTTRPFYHLPYSVYGPANLVGTAYNGLGATGQVASDSGWTLAYDLYGGEATVAEVEPYAYLKGDDELVELEEHSVREMVGGRLSLTTPGELTARLSGYTGKVPAGQTTARFSTLGVSLQYRGEQLWLSAETFHSWEADTETAWTAYATAAWMLTEHLQVALQYEWTRTTLAGLPSSPLLRHQSLGLGLAWWVNPSLVLKACWQQVEGNRFAFPEGSSSSALADPATAPSTRTGAFTLGTQFSF